MLITYNKLWMDIKIIIVHHYLNNFLELFIYEANDDVLEC